MPSCRNFIININIPNLNIGDYIYKVTFNKLNFHIEKLKILNIEEYERSHFSLLIDTYKICKCENNFECKLNNVDSEFKEDNCWVFSSIDKCKEFIIKYIGEEINYCSNSIKRYQNQLKLWEGKLKTYKKYSKNIA